MKVHIYLCLLLLATFRCSVYDWSAVDKSVHEAIQNRTFPGAVVLIGNATSTLYQNAYGSLSYKHDIYEQPTLNDTIFDVASLTKAMGTTAAVLTLYNSKLISLEDPISKYIPEFDSNGKRNITVGMLLLHAGGLPYDYNHPLTNVTPEEVLQAIFLIKPIYPVGEGFHYSNLGFIVLGEVVKRITKRTLGDYFHQNQVFMSLKETMFNPPSNLTYRIAPCEYDYELRHDIVRGEPHERLSYFLGGETGHSGYFTTAQDATRFARILLGLGKVGNENRILQASSVEKFVNRVTGLSYNNTRGYGTVKYDLGFDTVCPSHKMELCVGHDGSTGAMMWVSRTHNITIVVLSNRGHPDANNQRFWDWRPKFADTVMTVLGY